MATAYVLKLTEPNQYRPIMTTEATNQIRSGPRTHHPTTAGITRKPSTLKKNKGGDQIILASQVPVEASSIDQVW